MQGDVGLVGSRGRPVRDPVEGFRSGEVRHAGQGGDGEFCRPDDIIDGNECAGPTVGAGSRITEMASGVSRSVPVVTHDEDAVPGYPHLESHLRGFHWHAIGAIQVGVLVQRLAVDAHSPLGTAAGHGVTRHPDDPLDEVVRARVGQNTDEFAKLPSSGTLGGVGSQPVTRILEDDDVASLEISWFDGSDTITGFDGLLHGARGDDEELAHEGSDDRRDDQCQNEDENYFPNPLEESSTDAAG